MAANISSLLFAIALEIEANRMDHGRTPKQVQHDLRLHDICVNDY
jgi:hypothetical protein